LLVRQLRVLKVSLMSPRLQAAVPRRGALGALVALEFGSLPQSAHGKWVRGHSILNPGQAHVIAKFCFDYHAACIGIHSNDGCPFAERPGMMDFNVSVDASGESANVGVPEMQQQELYLALLDDEYFSYPEVSQVWSEASCRDVKTAAKKSIRLDWNQLHMEGGQYLNVPLVEKIRPRWWYIALVSCSGQAAQAVEISYSMHLMNRLRGWQGELSMDLMGVCKTALLLCAMFGLVLATQLRSVRAWMALSGQGQWLRIHPVLLLLTYSSCLAFLGNACWSVYYWHYMRDGEIYETWANLARLGVLSAKTIMQIIMLLLAQGQCICSCDIAWSDHSQLIWGMAVFGLFSFGLEVWGNTECWSTSTEFVYDTRPGCLLVAFDIFWLWAYASRSYGTLCRETRIKPRRFYMSYGLLFGAWFAVLPVVAALARVLAPWVRFGITFACSGLAHAVVLAILVYTFKPDIAVDLYELKMQEYKAINAEELNRLIQNDDGTL